MHGAIATRQGSRAAGVMRYPMEDLGFRIVRITLLLAVKRAALKNKLHFPNYTLHNDSEEKKIPLTAGQLCSYTIKLKHYWRKKLFESNKHEDESVLTPLVFNKRHKENYIQHSLK